jgi:hypothetical protein
MPLIVELAVDCGDKDEFLEVEVGKGRREVLDIFKQFGEMMIASDAG